MYKQIAPQSIGDLHCLPLCLLVAGNHPQWSYDANYNIIGNMHKTVSTCVLYVLKKIGYCIAGLFYFHHKRYRN